MTIMNTLLQHHPSSYNELAKLIIKTATKTFRIEKNELVRKDIGSITDIITLMEKKALKESEEDAKNKRLGIEQDPQNEKEETKGDEGNEEEDEDEEN